MVEVRVADVVSGECVGRAFVLGLFSAALAKFLASPWRHWG